MIVLRDVYKTFRLGDNDVHALRGVSMDIPSGQFISVTGPSGSGKSTLINILGLLESYDSGSYHLCERDVSQLDDDAASLVRNRHIGFVFQSFNLIPRLNALRNVELPLMYAGVDTQARRKRAEVALHIVGLGQRMEHTAAQLSGGQQQRVAIARALVTNPDIIIADEPTGALDTSTSHEIMDLLLQLNRHGTTIILVTHEDEIAAYAHRIIHVRDGVISVDRTT